MPSVTALLAGRYLLGLRRRTHVAAVSAISFLAMALGAAALVVTMALLEGFQSTIRRQLTEGGVHAELRPASGSVLPAGGWLQRLEARHPGLEVHVSRRGAVWCLAQGGAAPAQMEVVDGLPRVEVNRVLAARLGIGAGSELTVASSRQVLTPLGPMPVRRRVSVGRVVEVRPGEDRAVVQMPAALGAGPSTTHHR